MWLLDKITVLEGIVKDIGEELYQKWYNALPEDQRNEDHLKAMAKNANETSFFVIQMFMDKFNQAAEELKNS